MFVSPSRLVIKLGTGLLTTPRGNALDAAQFRRLTAEIAALVQAGHECLVVTSGAVGAGMVAVEELRFGDNDRLSAEVAILARADPLIVLTTAEGLTREPDGRGVPVPVVEHVDEVLHLASGSKGRLSTGGMATKLQAVKLAVEAGVEAVIANGRHPGLLGRIVRGETVGTRFPASRSVKNGAGSAAPASPATSAT